MSEPARKDDEQLSPFERFKQFARAIVAVPKTEIEQQEAEYRSERGRRRRTTEKRQKI
jgi:hypothetical protein